MTIAEQYLAICNRCPFRQRNCVDGQPCLCTADSLDILQHARDGHCPQNLYPPQRTLAGTIAHGVAGIAKAVTGQGGADAELVAKRSQICGECEHNVVSMASLGMVYKCDLCDCLTWAKARNLNEKCPIGKW